MTVELEPGLRVGDRIVAALVRQRVHSHCGRGGLSAWIEKRPVAILIVEGADARASDMNGDPLSLAEVERLRPGAADALRRAAPGPP